jgi:hypothetical protein
MKLTMLLAVPAVIWALRGIGRTRLARNLGLGLVGAAVVLGPAHLWAGRHVFDELRVARRFISLATPWRPVFDALKGPVGNNAMRDWVIRLTPILVVLLALALARVVRPAARLRPDEPEGLDPEVERVVSEGAVALVVLTTAYLLVAPYSLPWYDVASWAPLALVAGGAIDALLLLRLVTYALAYVPGRIVDMPAQLERVTMDYRRHVTPYVGWVLLAAVVLLAVRPRSREP